jgi:hypothetical protein
MQNNNIWREKDNAEEAFFPDHGTLAADIDPNQRTPVPSTPSVTGRGREELPFPTAFDKETIGRRNERVLGYSPTQPTPQRLPGYLAPPDRINIAEQIAPPSMPARPDRLNRAEQVAPPSMPPRPDRPNRAEVPETLLDVLEAPEEEKRSWIERILTGGPTHAERQREAHTGEGEPTRWWANTYEK